MKQMNIHLVSTNSMILLMKNESTFGDYKYNDHIDGKMIKEMKIK